jgi:hypothetical protein
MPGVGAAALWLSALAAKGGTLINFRSTGGASRKGAPRYRPRT